MSASVNVYAVPSLLYNAQPAFIGDPVYAITEQFGLITADSPALLNLRGQNEKYFLSSNGHWRARRWPI